MPGAVLRVLWGHLGLMPALWGRCHDAQPSFRREDPDTSLFRWWHGERCKQVLTWKPGPSPSLSSPRCECWPTEGAAVLSRSSLCCSSQSPRSHQSSHREKGREERPSPFPLLLNLLLECCPWWFFFHILKYYFPSKYDHCIRKRGSYENSQCVPCGLSTRCWCSDTVNRDRWAGGLLDVSYFNQVFALPKKLPQSVCFAIRQALVKNAHISKRH